MKWRVLPQKDVAADIARQLDDVLANHDKVLLLVSGGSAVNIEADVLQCISHTDHLSAILPIDERFGESGHADSNMAQLRLALPLDTTLPLVDILEDEKDFTATAQHYANTVTKLFDSADAVIAVLGIGPDGHTAGVLPQSPAVSSENPVVSYQWTDYRRMTLGLPLLRQIDQCFVVAYGEAKQDALTRLHMNAEPVEDLPAKLLHDIPNVTVYNEYINEG